MTVSTQLVVAALMNASSRFLGLPDGQKLSQIMSQCRDRQHVGFHLPMKIKRDGIECTFGSMWPYRNAEPIHPSKGDQSFGWIPGMAIAGP